MNRKKSYTHTPQEPGNGRKQAYLGRFLAKPVNKQVIKYALKRLTNPI